MTILVSALAKSLTKLPPNPSRASEQLAADEEIPGLWSDALPTYVLVASSLEALLRNGSPIGLSVEAIEVSAVLCCAVVVVMLMICRVAAAAVLVVLLLPLLWCAATAVFVSLLLRLLCCVATGGGDGDDMLCC